MLSLVKSSISDKPFLRNLTTMLSSKSCKKSLSDVNRVTSSPNLAAYLASEPAISSPSYPGSS